MAKETKKVVESTEKDLHAELAAKRQALLDAKKGHANGELANPHYINTLRKEIARILTAITIKQNNNTKENQ